MQAITGGQLEPEQSENYFLAVWASICSSLYTGWVIFKTSLAERLVYRGDFFFATFIRFLPIITQVFLWHQVYAVETDREI